MVLGAFGEMTTDAGLVGFSWVLWLDRHDKWGRMKRTTKYTFDNILGKGTRHAARRNFFAKVVEYVVYVFQEGRVIGNNNSMKEWGHAP